MTAVKLYDTTLRDGMQGHGMSLSAAEKVRVVHALDQLGVQFIEAGFPASNPKEAELFELLAAEELRQAAICAFGMTRRRGVEADRDEALQLLASTFAPVVTLVGMAQYGRDPWRMRGETFSVWFGLLGRMARYAPVGDGTGGEVRRRGFGTGLEATGDAGVESLL